MPPPSGNFETLQNILTKRKGLKLEVFSSGALAASLDKCIVRLLTSGVPPGHFAYSSVESAISAARSSWKPNSKKSAMLKKDINYHTPDYLHLWAISRTDILFGPPARLVSACWCETGPTRARVQYACANNGHEVHAFCGILLLWKRAS